MMSEQTNETGDTCPGCGHPSSEHYVLGHLGCHEASCPCERVNCLEVSHGVSEHDGRWIAYCRYHGFRASAPVQRFVSDAWIRHLTHECLIPTVEERSSTISDAEGNHVGYILSMDLWREVRALIARADALPPVTSSSAPEGGGQ